MEKITGIGGFFFYGKNPEALTKWYQQNLGIGGYAENYEHPSWWQDEGPTIFGAEPSREESDERPAHTWSINFRVRDLDAMVAQLRAAAIEVAVEETVYPNGRFAHLKDPEGNAIELWEPAGIDLVRGEP
ncbi:MAG: VOC family protein [Verrucomicrobiales bacterium]|nr:VOC family protein [Verrucomicrobiales bacterium]